jgi:ABC-type lipoprotein export system ATPase subunit
VAIVRSLSYDPDVILVSHSPDVAEMCDERYELVKISGKKK